MERYRVDKVVGQGSFGQAILCARIRDGKACIVKQVDTSKLPPKARREASKEATLLAKLSHPNIVGFWESFLHGPSRSVLCIVMDYADGGDLSSCLRRRKGRLLEEEVILDWFVQTTLALKHIHDRKILHRDLKTQNIFLTQSRVVKLGDFGIAKVLGSTFDLARTAIGTPYYMSPEICQEKRYNHKTDMWSLGCVLYEMTALRHAFDGSNMRQLAMKICAQDPRPISSRYSSGMRTLIRQLLKKDHHARPSTGAVLRQPLIKDKIGRFLSEAQIKEEFSNGVLPDPSASPAGGLPRSSPPGVVAPGRPLHAGDPGRERALRPSGLNGNHDAAPAVVGRAVAGGGGGRAARAAAVAASRAKERAAEADDRKRALARTNADRAAAKERGNLAAVALKIAKPSRRLKNDAGAAARKKQREARREEERAADAKRANLRAEVARVALGIGSPRRSFRHDAVERQAAGASPDAGRGRVKSSGSPPAEVGRGKASPPPCRPPSRAVPPQGMGADVGEASRGGGGGVGEANERLFQRVQNMRGDPSGAAKDAAQVGRPDGSGRLAEDEVAAGANPSPEEAGPALELARRWRAVRSVFGAGFGGEKKDEPFAQEEQKRGASEVSRSPARSSSPERPENSAADSLPSHEAAAKPVLAPPSKPAVEVSRVPEPKEEAEPTKALEEEKDRETTDQAGGVEDAGASDGASPCGGGPGEVISGAEEKNPSACAPLGCQGDGGRGGGGDCANGWTDAAETCDVVDCDAVDCEVGQEGDGAGRRSPISAEVEAADDGESKGSAAPSSRVDLGMEDGWFQKLEAKMGAIKKQVNQIKSPSVSTPHRKDESRHSANRRDQASPRSYTNTPPPNGTARDDHQRYGDRVDKEVDGSIPGGRRILQSSPRQPTCEPPHRDAKQHSGEGDEQLSQHSGENAPSTSAERRAKSTRSADGSQRPNGQNAEPVSAIVPSFRPGDASSPAALRRCNSQQPSLLAAAAAIEAAAVAVAAIPKIPAENRTPVGQSSGSDGDIRGHPSQYVAKDKGADLAESPRGGVSGRARRSPLGNAQIKVVRTPARRPGGGRGGGKPPLSGRSERKPPRHAAALSAELERHSDKRPSRKMKIREKTPSGDAVRGEPHTPSAEERVQTLRAARNRERAELRALIAQRRKASNVAEVGGSPEGSPDGDEADQVREWSTPSGWATGSPVPRPRQPDARVAASEPPPRRRFRSQNGVVPSKGAVAAGDKGRSPGGGLVDAPHRPRGPRNNEEENHKVAAKRQTASSSKVARDPARRNQDLRAFIAESRRENRAKQGDRIGGVVSVWAGAGAGGLDDSTEVVKPAADLAAPTPMRTPGDGPVVGARRNIGLDFDEEDKAREGEGRVEGGVSEAKGDASNERTDRESSSQSRSKNGGGGDRGSGANSNMPPPAIAASPSRRTSDAEDNRAELSMPEGSIVAELHEVPHEKPQGQHGEESVVQEAGSVLSVEVKSHGLCSHDAGKQYRSKDEEDKACNDHNGSSSSNSSSRSGAKSAGEPCSEAVGDADYFSAVSSDKGEDEGGVVHGNDIGEDASDSEAGVMEGVHPGLATYESQRAAVGVLGGGGGAGLEEYARMLEQMQEVLALGEDASSDSSWGGSTSDEKRDSEEKLKEKGNEERSTSRSTASDCGVEEMKEAGGGGGGGGGGDISGEPSHGQGGNSAEAVLDEASNRGQRDQNNPPQESPRESNGTGEEGVDFHDSNGDTRAEVAGFRRCGTGGGVAIACGAEENPPPPGGKDDKLPRVPDPQGSSSPVSSCSALEYSGSGPSALRQAVDEPLAGATPRPRDTVSERGATGGGILAWVDGNIEEDHHATCQSDELRGVELSGTRTADPDADPVGRHMGTKDGCGTTNGCIAPCEVVAAAGTGESSLPSEPEERDEGGEASRPGQTAVIAASRMNGSLLFGRETAATNRFGKEESEACVPTRTRGGLLSGEEGGASLSKEEEKSLRDRLRGVIGDDRFLDACRYLREVDVGKDDNEMDFEVERILGGPEYLPDLLRLLAAETQSLDGREGDDRVLR